MNFIRIKNKNKQQSGFPRERVWSWRDRQNAEQKNRFIKRNRFFVALIIFIERFSFKAKTFFLKHTSVAFRAFFVDHWKLLTLSAAENHLRIQACKREQKELCNIEFSSYSQLKKYQKKVKILTYSTSSTILSIAAALIVIQILFPGAITHSATFHFSQTNWSTQSANTASHNSNQTNWTQYESKDAGITTINGGNDLQLAQITSSTTQTTDADFGAGTKTNTESLGVGNSASVSTVKDLHVNEYTVGHLANVGVTVTAVNQGGPWLLTLSGTPNLSRIFKNDKFVDSTGKPWKVLSLNPSSTTPRLLVIDSEGNGGAPASGAGSVGRWYGDLSAWEAGRQGDLVTRNAVERALPYYDVGPDTTAVTINGWVTDATRYVEINVPLGERHRGKWDDTKYRMNVNGIAIDDYANYTKIEGLQINAATGVYHHLNSDTYAANNIVRESSAGSWHYGFRTYLGTRHFFYNNIVYGFTDPTGEGFGVDSSYLYNNTVVGAYTCYASNSVLLKNNIAQGCVIGYFAGGNAGSTNNLSNDATAPGTNPQNNKTVAFVDAANKDFHLEFNDTTAKNVGVDLSADASLSIKIDIDGDTRTGTWDIGADDAGAVYVHTSSIGTASRDFTTLQAWEDARDGILTTRNVFKISAQSGAFVDGEVITGGTSGKTGTYVSERATPSASEKYMSLDSATGAFTVGETLTGATSGKTATLSSIITTTGTIEKGEAYNDSAFTSGVDISGVTADANRFMWLTVEPRSRHWGVANAGATLKLPVSGTAVLVRAQYSIIEWLIIDGQNNNFTNGIGTSTGGINSIVRNNVIYGLNAPSAVSTGIYIYDGGTAYNNIIYNLVGNLYGIMMSWGGCNSYNNTVFNTPTGFYINNAGPHLANNNIALNNTTSFVASGATWNAASSNNISFDYTAAGANSKTNQSLGDIKFVSTDPSLIDLHLMPGSVAKNAGADLSATFKNDMDGNARPTGVNTWDIGADEWQASSPIFKTSGIFESNSIDLGVKADISSLSINANTGAGTNLKTQIAVNDDNATWNYVDVGQSQSGIPIYYSVGQNTTDHKTGSPTVTIASGVATFSVAQTATNMGVGDKITYNGATVAYISGKISQTQWKVITNLGATPAAVTNQTVNSIAHAFSSLSAAITGVSGASFLNTTDLVGWNYQLNLPCYYDTGIDNPVNTVSVSNGGLVTSKNNFLKIYTPNNVITEVNASQRHTGKWTNNAYTLKVNNNNALNIGVDIEIAGLQVMVSGLNGEQYNNAIRIPMYSNGIAKIHDNIVYQQYNNGNPNESCGIRIYIAAGSGQNASVYNNVVYNFKNLNNVGNGIDVAVGGAIYNNTVYGNDNGLKQYNLATFSNNLAFDNAIDFTGTPKAGSVKNFSKDATANGTSPIHGTLDGKNVQFVSTAIGAEDFHLQSNSDAKNVGSDLSADSVFGFNTDADGQYRSGLWDIGADEEGASTSLGAFRYARYKTFFTSDSANTPKLNDITLGYTSFPASASLISSPYNTTDNANVLADLKWSETKPANSDVTFQVRTSPDGAAWTSWVGPNGTNATEFTDSLGGETLPFAFAPNKVVYNDNLNDKFIQYKTTLHSDGTATPTVSDVDMTYVVNAPPEIQNVTAIQNSDGTVTVNYEVKDSDTTTGTLNGSVNTTLQYCSANCTNAGSEIWTNATTISGNLGSVAVAEGSYNSYTAAWNPKTDYDGNFNANMKMRVKVDDNEAANNLAYGISPIFTLDTKAPTNVSLLIDGRTKTLTIATPVDDSSYQMKVSNFADFHDATLQAFSSNLAWPTLGADTATVYLQIVDAKGNFTSSNSTTPQKPKNIVYFDVSNSAVNDYREFIAWSVVAANEVGAVNGISSTFGGYKIERKENSGSFSLLASQAVREANFYMDNNLDTSKLYSYRAYTEDSVGNKSGFSDVVSDTPNGQGGTDTTPPTISNLTIQSVTPTTANITWTTDELSDSSIGYSQDMNYASTLGNSSMTMNHSVTLVNLIPETAYHLRIESRDPLNNLGRVDESMPLSNLLANFTITTAAGPKITNVIIPTINDNAATIEWTTNINANSKVNYSEIVSNGSLSSPQSVTDSAVVKNHSIQLTNLTQNTNYYFEVVSVDGGNNETVEKNGGMFFELTTTQDNTAPVISDVTNVYVSSNAAVISFVTDENARVKFNYGKTNKNSNKLVTTFDRSHTIFLDGLTSDDDYIFDIEVFDIYGNTVKSSEQNFKTLKDVEFSHPPLVLITFADPNPSILTDITAVISFATDQNANCLVEYGTQSGSYGALPIKESTGVFNSTHAIQLLGLVFQSKYFYKVTCEDNLGTVISSDEKDFTTKEKMYTAAGIGTLGDHTAPVVNNISISDIFGEGVTINWDTDENANSLIRYGIDSNYGNMAGNDAVNAGVDKFVKNHTITFSGLVPATRYVFVVVASDESGNIASSAESSFTTASPSALSSIKAESKSLGQATISWNTDQETTSIVEYGLTTSYGEKKENSTYSADHSIDLSKLNQGVVYHYRVKGKDKDGKYFASSDQTFEPKSPAKISNISINDITEHGATVSFKTDVPTDANVTFTDVRDSATTGSQGSRDLATEHKIELVNLNQGTTFAISIAAKDEQGTEAIMKAQDFTTGKDENPPVIDNIKTDNALTQSDKVQSIISWRTNEQSTTSILYREGKNGEEKEIKFTDALTTNHVGVITIFKPGVVYNFRVKSTDVSGNEAISGDFALLTPKKKENIIQIIISNFTDIFGWANR